MSFAVDRHVRGTRVPGRRVGQVVAFLLSLSSATREGSIVRRHRRVALVAATALGYRITSMCKRRLLWRVRRKLIVSYIFIGFVPVLLIISFFMVSGRCCSSTSARTCVRSRIDTLVGPERFLAETRGNRDATGADAEGRRGHADPTSGRRRPALSDGVVCLRACGRAVPGCSRRSPAVCREVAGPWAHLRAPDAVPDWLKCRDYVEPHHHSAGEQQPRVARGARRRVAGWRRPCGHRRRARRRRPQARGARPDGHLHRRQLLGRVARRTAHGIGR